MDRYFKNSARPLQVNDLHAIGVASMYLASDQEDFAPLSLETVNEKISQRTIPIETIEALSGEI